MENAYNFYFDAYGAYTMTTQAYADATPPPNALRVSPDFADGYWSVVNAAGDGWELVEDHRGKEGYVNGEQTKITTLGPLPDGWSDDPPLEPPVIKTSAEMREEAYQVEIDSIRDKIINYQVEADAWLSVGNSDKAEEVEATINDLQAEYLSKKREIRARYPDAVPSSSV